MERVNFNPQTSGLAGALSLNLNQDQNFTNPLLSVMNPQHPSNLPNYGGKNTIHPPSQPFSPNPTGGLAQYGSYMDKLGKVESGGDYGATNKSGATGKYQFFESTAKPYLDKMGKTWSDFKSDNKLQDEVAKQWTDTNRQGLTRAGIEPTDLNLWVAHNQGLRGAVNMLKHGKGNERNIRANLFGNAEPTVQNYLSQWGQRF